MFYVLWFVILQFIAQSECSKWSFSSTQIYCIEEGDIFLVRNTIDDDIMKDFFKNMIVDPESGTVDPCLVLYSFNFRTLNFAPLAMVNDLSENILYKVPTHSADIYIDKRHMKERIMSQLHALANKRNSDSAKRQTELEKLAADKQMIYVCIDFYSCPSKTGI